MEELANLLEVEDFDPIENRIRCFPHIINLCSRAALSSFSSSEGPEADDDDLPDVDLRSTLQGQTYEDALNSDPVSAARKLIFKLRSSDGRKSFLEDAICEANKGRLKPIKANTQLLRDVRHRWDSVYHMLKRFRKLQDVSLYLC
jgi:hypothetical protein